MSLFGKPSEIEIKRYNYWVNFDVLPGLVLAYNENQLPIDEFKSITHFSDGSKLYDKLKKKMSFSVISTKSQPDFVFFMITTPSNGQVCEVALACIAVNKILHNALLMTMEYTFNSTYVICEPTTTLHSNFGINVDNGEQFAVSAYNLALKRWYEMSLNKVSNEEKSSKKNSIEEVKPIGEMIGSCSQKKQTHVLSTKPMTNEEKAQDIFNRASLLAKRLQKRLNDDELENELLVLCCSLLISLDKDKEQELINCYVQSSLKTKFLSSYSASDWFHIFESNTPGACFASPADFNITSWTIDEFEDLKGKLKVVIWDAVKGSKRCYFIDKDNRITPVSFGSTTAHIAKMSVDAAENEIRKMQNRLCVTVESPNRYVLERSVNKEYDGLDYLIEYINMRFSFYCAFFSYISSANLKEQKHGLHNMYCLMKEMKNDLNPSILYNRENDPAAFCKDDYSISTTFDSSLEFRSAILDMMDNLGQKAGSKMSPPRDIKKDDIKQSWPLLDFHRSHGRMSVLSCVSKNDGSRYKSCKFCDNNDKIVYVSFSNILGELTAKEIAARKEELMIVLTKTNEYVLCSSEELIDEDEVDLLLH